MKIRQAEEEVLAAFKTRAILYHYLYEEMEQAMGKEKAGETFKRATYRRGKDFQEGYRDCLISGDFPELARRFVELSACGGGLFLPQIEKADEKAAIVSMSRCPLVEAWKEQGLSGEAISNLCDVASAIDYGTFETEKTELSFSHKIGNSDEMCRLIISKKG